MPLRHIDCWMRCGENFMARVKVLLLVACSLTLAALVAWQSSATATIPTAPARLQLKPLARAGNTDVVAAAPSKGAAAAAPAKEISSTMTTKAPRRVTRRDPPPTVAVERRENAVPPAAVPDVSVPPARPMTYDQRLADATTAARQDSDRALLDLQRLASDEPARPEAYEAMAGISLRKRDYGQARDLLGSALAHGGRATFALIHDHVRGNFDKGDPKATCVGELIILADQVRFESYTDGDRFSASWAEVREAGSNRFFGSGIGGFHVAITTGGKYKNFNLAPESKDKAEGKLILDLLNTYTRSDRTR
jgi:hypothetical protein